MPEQVGPSASEAPFASVQGMSARDTHGGCPHPAWVPLENPKLAGGCGP